MSTDDAPFDREFFEFYYNPESPATGLFPPLREKYKAYRQQSYYTPRAIVEVNFVRKFEQVCQYVNFVGALKAEKMEIGVIQQVMEEVLDEFERFFASGGWRAVKNKSNSCRLQEYVLLKLGRLFPTHRLYATLDNFLLCFFYTLNYFKTCNYEIKLFSEFLQAQAELDHFFLFIVLRKRSRRHHRDLVLRSEHIAAIVSVLKSEQLSSPSQGISLYASENDDLGEVKLLLIFPEIVEYIRANEVVLHEVMIYNLMRCAGLTQEQNPLETNRLNWAQFFTSYFSQVCVLSSSYPHALIQHTVAANLKIADRLFGREQELSRMTFSDSGEPPVCQARERYLEESFGWLIGTLEGLIYRRKEGRWQRLYDQGAAMHEYGLFVGRQLIQEIMKSAEFFDIYSRHASKGSTSVQF